MCEREGIGLFHVIAWQAATRTQSLTYRQKIKRRGFHIYIPTILFFPGFSFLSFAEEAEGLR